MHSLTWACQHHVASAPSRLQSCVPGTSSQLDLIALPHMVLQQAGVVMRFLPAAQHNAPAGTCTGNTAPHSPPAGSCVTALHHTVPQARTWRTSSQQPLLGASSPQQPHCIPQAALAAGPASWQHILLSRLALAARHGHQTAPQCSCCGATLLTEHHSPQQALVVVHPGGSNFVCPGWHLLQGMRIVLLQEALAVATCCRQHIVLPHKTKQALALGPVHWQRISGALAGTCCREGQPFGSAYSCPGRHLLWSSLPAICGELLPVPLQ